MDAFNARPGYLCRFSFTRHHFSAADVVFRFLQFILSKISEFNCKSSNYRTIIICNYYNTTFPRAGNLVHCNPCPLVEKGVDSRNQPELDADFQCGDNFYLTNTALKISNVKLTWFLEIIFHSHKRKWIHVNSPLRVQILQMESVHTYQLLWSKFPA